MVNCVFSGASDNKLFVLSQQSNQLINLLGREVLLLDKEVDEVCRRTAEEAVFDVAHIVAGVFATQDYWTEPMLLAGSLAGDEALLLQYAQEGEHCVVGRPRLWVVLQHLGNCALADIPEDIHDLQLCTSQFIRSFHSPKVLVFDAAKEHISPYPTN